jgi:hypothetical protein
VQRAPPDDAAVARLWAGAGSGVQCQQCGMTIETSQVEYEIELRAGAAYWTVRLHRECHRGWQAQRAGPG